MTSTASPALNGRSRTVTDPSGPIVASTRTASIIIQAEAYTTGLAILGVAPASLLANRDLCAVAMGRYHPALGSRAVRRIEACTDVKRLRGWILRAPETSDEAFSRLLGLTPKRRTTVRAKAAPARRAARVTRKNP
jgi:hypothetical protein